MSKLRGNVCETCTKFCTLIILRQKHSTFRLWNWDRHLWTMQQCLYYFRLRNRRQNIKYNSIDMRFERKKMRWVDSSHHIKNLFSKNWDFFLSTTDEKKNQKWPYVSLSEGNCLWSFISERLLKIATAGEHRPDWVTNNISRHKSMVCNHHIPNRKGNWSLDALI